jgi:hypothetical protein
MALGNLNCPIMLEVKPDGAGWAEVKMHIGKDDYVFTVSYIGEDIHDLIEKVYYLYPNWGHDDHNNKVMEYYDDVEIESTIDGVTVKRIWTEVPWRTELLWDGEGSYMKLKMERPATIDDDFDVTITLEVYQQEESFHTYTVRYKDLCYAVAKGVTEALIRYGIVGCYESTWMQDINIRHFLQIKGLALDKEIELVPDSQNEKSIFYTRLGQELDLLIRPMS